MSVQAQDGNSGPKATEKMIEISDLLAALDEDQDFAFLVRFDKGPDDVHFVMC